MPLVPSAPDEVDHVVSTGTPTEGVEVYEKVKEMLTTIQKVGWKESTTSIKYAMTYLRTCPLAKGFTLAWLAQIISILLDQEHAKLATMAFERGCVEESLKYAVQLIAKDLEMRMEGGLLPVSDSSKAAGGAKPGPEDYDTMLCPHLGTLAQIFDPSRLFYARPKSKYSNTPQPHNDKFRRMLVAQFTDSGGTANLCAYLTVLLERESLASSSFMPMDQLALLVRGLEAAFQYNKSTKKASPALASLADFDTPPPSPGPSMYDTPPPTPNDDLGNDPEMHDVDMPPPSPSPSPAPPAAPLPPPLESLISQTADAITSKILATDVELFKNVSAPLRSLTFAVQHLVTALSNPPASLSSIVAPAPHSFYVDFAFPHIEALLNSKTLSLKLQATTMLTNLTVQSRAIKPPPVSFIVSGAGLAWANGTYTGNTEPLGEAPKYHLRVKEFLPKEVTLTLFRCQMRSNQKWWFISEADLDQPGTDKDIDYYQHKSTEADEALPPRKGWLTSKGPEREKRAPAPTLTPVYADLDEDNLETWLKEFVAKKEVWEALWGGHREVIRRGGEVVKWMSEVGGVKSSHLDDAWKSCVAKGPVESAETINILTSILPILSPEPALHLLASVKATLVTNKTTYVETSNAFLESLSNQNVAKGASDDVKNSIMDLLWATLTHSSLASKSHASLLDFFLTNLTPEQISEYLRRCIGALKDAKKLKHPLNTIQITHSLLKTAPTDDIITSTDLPGLLFAELLHHVGKGEVGGVKERLEVVRFIYGKTEEVNISFEQLKSCWDLAASNLAILADILSFLSSASNFNPPSYTSTYPTTYSHAPYALATPELLSCFDLSVAKRAFAELVCTMDWTGTGDEAQDASEVACYRSFKEILEGVRIPGVKLSSKDVGLTSLWQIALSASNAEVVSQAGSDLLQLYTSLPASPQATEAFISTIFKSLTSSDSKLTISRCIQLLCSAVRCGENNQYESITFQLASMTSSTCRNVVSSVPHGLRSAACNSTVNILTKKLPGARASSEQSHARDSVVTTSNPQHPAAAPITTTPPSTKVIKGTFPLSVHPLETIESIRHKVAMATDSPLHLVKPTQLNNKRSKEGMPLPTINLNSSQTNIDYYMATASELNVTDGTDITFLILPNEDKTNRNYRKKAMPLDDQLDVASLFSDPVRSGRYFETLMKTLEELPKSEGSEAVESSIWDFLISVPSNQAVVDSVKAAAGITIALDDSSTWSELLSPASIHKSVYVMQVIDFLLQPADELCSTSTSLLEESKALMEELRDVSVKFKKGFIETGGFQALLKLFVGRDSANVIKGGMGNAVALRVLKFCLFDAQDDQPSLLNDIKDPKPLLIKLATAALSDTGESVIVDAVEMLRLLLQSADNIITDFIKLPNGIPEDLVTKLLLRAGGGGGKSGVAVRQAMLQAIVEIPQLGTIAFPWLLKRLVGLSHEDEHVTEFFGVLNILVKGKPSEERPEVVLGPSAKHLALLGDVVCRKMLSLAALDAPPENTAVLNGCLDLIRRLVETKVQGGGDASLKDGCKAIQKARASGVLDRLTTKIASVGLKGSASTALSSLVDLIFEKFLFVMGEGRKPICNDDDSRRLAFNVVAALSRLSVDSTLKTIPTFISGMIEAGEPRLRNKYQYMSSPISSSSSFKGLRNQGCTCYMNSLLQQLYMMEDVRKNICDAKLPEGRREAGNKGGTLVGKRLKMHWESGGDFEADVLSFDEKTGMHTIQYTTQTNTNPPSNSNSYGQNRYNTSYVTPSPQEVEDLKAAFMLEEKVVELYLDVGRQGRENGFYTVEGGGMAGGEESGEKSDDANDNARKMVEELQKTFVNLASTTSPAYDPRSLVSASACLNLEFDVYQQNDAAEYQTKLFDKLEVVLGKYDKAVGNETTNRFQMGMTKQKICRECGLTTTSAQEVAVNMEGPVRGRSDVHELIGSYCSEELMSGDNKVNCDRCEKKTDTLLRTSVSKFPKCFTVSLKRFDLDFETFETVKLNSRLEFGLNLNMKKYSLEAREAIDKHVEEVKAKMKEDEDDGGKDGNGKEDGPTLERASSFGYDPNISGNFDPLSTLPDDDYEYSLSGVLVHAGVAQGGHYYSFVKDRESGSWFKFDDEDVTPFDVSKGEDEWFGGRMMKETKWPNGAVNVVESERYANAMMLFYEKVKCDDGADDEDGPMKGEKAAADDDEGEEEKEKEKEKEEEGIEEKSEGKDKAEDEAEDEAAVVGNSGFHAYLSEVHAENDIHVRNNYLFDVELSAFLQALLVGTPSLEVTQTCTKFFFDAFMHGLGTQRNVEAWRDALCAAFEGNVEASSWMVKEVAERLQNRKSGSWLIQVACDAPSPPIREAGLSIIAVALKSCIQDQREASKLTVWAEAWKKQTTGILMGNGGGPYPSKLENNLAASEDFTGAAGSATGVILSAVNGLIGMAPQFWKASSELLDFIAKLQTSELLREACLASHMHVRLACLCVRANAPEAVRAAFPGPTMAPQIVERLRGGGIGGVGQHAQHMTFAGGFGGVAENDLIASVLGALTGILGVPGTLPAPLHDKGKGSSHNPPLTAEARAAFRYMFDACRGQSKGMDVAGIMTCMRLCNVPQASVSNYTIKGILSKYPSETLKGGEKALTLEGFLKYHSDTAKVQDARVREDLNVFGYRRDLTKREFVEVITDEHGKVELTVEPAEAAARDFWESGPKVAEVGEMGYAIASSLEFWRVVYGVDAGLSTSCVAAFWSGRDTTDFINEVLKELVNATGMWNVNDTVALCGNIFEALVAIPDERREARIEAICQSDREVRGLGIGLFVVAREFAANPSKWGITDQEAVLSYLGLVRQIRKIEAVMTWMDGRPAAWQWMSRWLNGDAANQGRAGGIEGGAADDDDVAVGGGEAFADSDDDDLGVIIVGGAGVEACNGRYGNSGMFDGVGKWTKEVVIDGRTETMCVYRCKLSNNTRRWFFSVVPKGGKPGTDLDIDYYQSQIGGGEGLFPPADGWRAQVSNGGCGVEPGPVIQKGGIVISDIRGMGLGGDDLGDLGDDSDSDDSTNGMPGLEIGNDEEEEDFGGSNSLLGFDGTSRL